MKAHNYFFVVLLFSCFTACISVYQSTEISTQKSFIPAGKNMNVCKELLGKVVIYSIFVDTKQALPWTEFDITSTQDSIARAADWLMAEAKKRKIDLDIQLAYHENKNVMPIAMNLPKSSLCHVMSTPRSKSGKHIIDSWSNKIAKQAGMSLPKDTSRVIKTKNVISERERLVAKLRDIYKTDNVVILYFVNNYFKEELSVSLYTNTSLFTEFSIISFKNPAVIAHEVLHLFGATDLYPIAVKSRKGYSYAYDYETLNKDFPNEIMYVQHKQINKLMISPITEYLVGWSKSLDNCYSRLLYSNYKPLEY